MRMHRFGLGRLAAGLGLLAAVAMAACSPAAAAPSVRTVAVTIHYSHFSPEHLHIPVGTTVRFRITNTDPIDHEFILGDQAIQDEMERTTETVHDGRVPGMVSVPALSNATTVVTLPRGAGSSLIYACHLPGHYAYGMRGLLSMTR